MVLHSNVSDNFHDELFTVGGFMIHMKNVLWENAKFIDARLSTRWITNWSSFDKNVFANGETTIGTCYVTS